jgi:hypothetical protein
MRRSLFIVLLLIPRLGWCWGDEGHQTVARIAAAHLSPKARQAVLDLLSHDPAFSAAGADVAALMAAAAIWPDHMPGGKGPTAPWHYIDVGLFEGPSQIAARCPNGDCIVAKMNQYLVNLKQHRADGAWPDSKELAFLLHFAGDIHQPLHCVTNADAGGNCVNVIGFEGIKNLHAAWDITLVRSLMAKDGTGMIAGMEARFHGKQPRWQNYGSIEAIAAESWGLAKSQVYGKTKPRLPVIAKFIDVQPRNCATDAPESVRQVQVDGPRSFGAGSLKVVREQLYKGGVRLAAMLNATYGE